MPTRHRRAIPVVDLLLAALAERHRERVALAPGTLLAPAPASLDGASWARRSKSWS